MQTFPLSSPLQRYPQSKVGKYDLIRMYCTREETIFNKKDLIKYTLKIMFLIEKELYHFPPSFPPSNTSQLPSPAPPLSS